MDGMTIKRSSARGLVTAPGTYLRNRCRELVRWLMPAHWRFERAGKSFLVDGEREVHELPRLVEPGTVAVDVGAHIGDYTYALCRQIGKGGRVVAIEPIPDLARMLERATRRLRLPVTVINCALSSKAGQGELLIPMENGSRKAGFATLERREGAGRMHRVALRRLDDVCAAIEGRISFIKIDVEGHELEVLRGGTGTLAKHRPNLLIEIEQRHSAGAIEETLKYVTSLGYRGEFLDAANQPQALETFEVARHQRVDRVGTRQYVSNFIFRPV
jgi:FkbM family methyltransferase